MGFHPHPLTPPTTFTAPPTCASGGARSVMGDNWQNSQLATQWADNKMISLLPPTFLDT